MKRVLFTVIITLSVIQLNGQDIHFSQFYNMSQIVNPALTGVFGGNQRATIVYRNQWPTVATPFKTYGVSFDTRLLDKRGSKFSLGTGLSLYKDVAGDVGLGTTNAILSISGIIALNKKQHLSIGVQGGLEQRSINNTALIWDNQYDGSGYDPTLPSQEQTNYDQGISSGDINTGIVWVYSESTRRIVSQDEFSLKLGAAYQHLTRQEIKYNEISDKLYSKLSFNGESTISVNGSNVTFKPSFLYQKQGPSQEILIGSLIRYTFGYDSKYTGILSQTALLLGVHSRIGDAFIPSIGYEIANWKLMFSYDANYSKLTPASKSVGGFEVTLIFINNPFTYGKGSRAKF